MYLSLHVHVAYQFFVDCCVVSFVFVPFVLRTQQTRPRSLRALLVPDCRDQRRAKSACSEELDSAAMSLLLRLVLFSLHDARADSLQVAGLRPQSDASGLVEGCRCQYVIVHLHSARLRTREYSCACCFGSF